MNFFSSLDRGIDYFLPRKVREVPAITLAFYEKRRKARFIVIFSLLCGILFLGRALFPREGEFFSPFFWPLIGVLSLVNIVPVKIWGAMTTSGSVVMALSWMAIIIQNSPAGGEVGIYGFWLVFLSFLAIVLLKRTWVFFWILVGFSALLVIVNWRENWPTLGLFFLFSSFVTLLYEWERKQYKIFMLDFEKKALANERIKSIGRVSAGMAHEIKNPLTVISGKIMRMNKNLKGIDPFCQSDHVTSLKKDLEKINIHVAKISQRTQELIAYAQGQGENSVEVFTLKELAAKLRESLPPLFENQGVKLLFPNVSPIEESMIQGHLHLIEKVIFAMVENGLEANRERDGGWVNLGFEIKSKNRNPFLKLTITDSGEGLESSVVDKIFDPFFTTRNLGENKGLNLGLSRTIIKQHGGFLTYNPAHTSTQFILELPLIHPL